jgi:hypothetical protein
MGGWTFFADLFNSLIAPNMQALLAMLGQVCATASRVALPLIAIMFVLSFFEMAAGTKSLQAFFKEAFVAALVYGFLQEAQYTQFIVNMVTQGAPNTIARAMGGTGSPVASLDNLLAAVVVEVAKVYEALPSYSLKTVPLALADLFAMGLSAVCIAFCFGVYVVATIINIGALVVGPLFMAGAVAPWSRKFAMGWVAVLVGGCVTQLISVAMLQLLITGEMNLIHASAAAAASSDSNSIVMLWSLCKICLLLFISKKIIEEIPVIAKTIGGGVYAATSNRFAHAATLGAAGAAAGAAVGAARGVAVAAATKGIGAARAAAPAGQSLSRAA